MPSGGPGGGPWLLVFISLEAITATLTTPTGARAIVYLPSVSSKPESTRPSWAGAAADREGLWREFRELAQEKAVLIKGERNWLAKLRSMYTVEQGLALQHAVLESARETFGEDPHRLAEFLNRIIGMFDEPKRIAAAQE